MKRSLDLAPSDSDSAFRLCANDQPQLATHDTSLLMLNVCLSRAGHQRLTRKRKGIPGVGSRQWLCNVLHGVDEVSARLVRRKGVLSGANTVHSTVNCRP